jgi:hypothetical protein
VERVPQLADYEELLALDKAVLDCPGHALTGLLLVAVICDPKSAYASLY